MSKRSRVKLFVALAVGLAVSPALAQHEHDHHSASTSSAVQQADAVVSTIDAAAQAVGKQLATARAAKDVVKSLCLNDKLSQINAAKSAAKQKKAALVSDVGQGTAGSSSAQSDAMVLSTLGDRVRQLVSEANQCIGNEASTTEGSTTTQTVDSDQAAEPPPAWFPAVLPGDLPSAGGIIVAPPGSFVTNSPGIAPPECVSPDQ